MIPRAVREGSQRSKSKTWGVVSWEGSTRHACCHVVTLRIVPKGRCIAVGKSAVVVTWVADASGHMDVLWTSLIVCTQTFFGFWPKQHLSFASLSHGLHRNYIQQTRSCPPSQSRVRDPAVNALFVDPVRDARVGHD